MSCLLVLAVLLTGAGEGADDALEAARRAAQKQDWVSAAARYGDAAAVLPHCGELAYDVGTAAAQAGQVGLAVLHLERALRENPWDSDARQNLEKVRARRVDKVMGQEPGESPLQRLAADLPGRSLFWTSLLLFWLGCGIWFLRSAGRSRASGGWVVLLLLLAAAAFGGSFASDAERSVRYAVVVSGEQGVKVRGGPAADLPSSFEIHDGLKILLLDSENGFTHIRLGNGLEGYVPETDVQEI